MSRGRGRCLGCDCNIPCVAFQDSFNRGDSGTVSGWTEITPDWSIVSQVLREAGNSGALIRADTPSFRKAEQFVTVGAKDFTTGDKYRLYLDWVLNTSNYYYAEFEKLAPIDDWQVTLFNSGGSPLSSKTMTAVIDPDTTTGLIACMTGGYNHDTALFKAYMDMITPVEEFPWEVVVPNRGKYSGLGNGGSSQIEFDNYQLINPNTVNQSCQDCMCMCEGNPIPRVLLATFSSPVVGNIWNCIDGATATLTWSPLTGQWEGTESTGQWDVALSCGGGLQPDRAMCIILTGVGDGIDTGCCSHFEGDIDVNVLCTGFSSATSCAANANFDSTCDPIVLNYGPWILIPESDISCFACGDQQLPPDKPGGSFSVIVTEP